MNAVNHIIPNWKLSRVVNLFGRYGSLPEACLATRDENAVVGDYVLMSDKKWDYLTNPGRYFAGRRYDKILERPVGLFDWHKNVPLRIIPVSPASETATEILQPKLCPLPMTVESILDEKIRYTRQIAVLSSQRYFRVRLTYPEHPWWQSLIEHQLGLSPDHPVAQFKRGDRIMVPERLLSNAISERCARKIFSKDDPASVPKIWISSEPARFQSNIAVNAVPLGAFASYLRDNPSLLCVSESFWGMKQDPKEVAVLTYLEHYIPDSNKHFIPDLAVLILNNFKRFSSAVGDSFLAELLSYLAQTTLPRIHRGISLELLSTLLPDNKTRSHGKFQSP